VSAFGFVTAWANAPFAIAASLAAIFALLQVTGILGLVAGGDHDADADGHAEGADADADHSADAGHDADGDGDADDAGGKGWASGWGSAALSGLGLGRIPFSIIWQTYALAFAMAGYATNIHYLGRDEAPPPVTLAWSVPVALFAGYLVVALLARILGPVLSSKEQEATSRAHLVGQIGVVISSRVDHDFGEVRIRDKTGHDVRVICKLPKGHTDAVREHESVVVVECDDRGDLLVEPLGDALGDEIALRADAGKRS
jgi:membrane protein implicated in regulation of membrane protease activity